MKRIILYRYYHNFSSNKERLKFIQYLNPNVPIYGLYGGPANLFSEASECLKDFLEHNYLINVSDPTWKWRNADMEYQFWFNEFGYSIDFDIMHDVEWDLLYFEPLDRLFAHVSKETLALTGLIPLWMIKRKWYWTNDEKKKQEFIQLMKVFRHEHQYNFFPYAMVGPGTSLPRKFLEKLSNVIIPDLEVDEIRIPLFAQDFGLKMVNTNFLKVWFSRNENKVFNCDSQEITLNTIRNHLSTKNGRRVFHPFRQHLSFEELKNLYESIPPYNSDSFLYKFQYKYSSIIKKLPPRVHYVNFLNRK